MVAEDKKSDKVPLKKPSGPQGTKFNLLTPLFAIGGYFKGSWIELKEVRWPNRRETWGMTAAVLIFTGLFVALIVALDNIFNLLFKLIVK